MQALQHMPTHFQALYCPDGTNGLQLPASHHVSEKQIFMNPLTPNDL
jgi:hypothetical protein